MKNQLKDILENGIVKSLHKPIVLPLIVIMALLLVIIVVKTKPAIDHEQLQFPTKTVEVITAKKLPFRSRAIAYGNIEPAVLLKAKPEISGKISYIHPLLKKGSSLAKGTVVVRVEPTTFEFTRDQNQAALEGSESSLRQLEVEEKSTKRSLEIVRKNLQAGQNELDRIQTVWEKRLVSRSVVDAEQQKVLQLQQQVEDLQGKLASYASRKSVIEAQIKQSKTQLEQSKDTLGRTEIILPFDARIGEVFVEKGEYVAVGNQLFEASGTQVVEINAQLPVRQFSPLLTGRAAEPLNLQNPEELQNAFLRLQLKAVVRIVGYEGEEAQWQGQLLRIGEEIDPDRDTIDLIVAVNNPYKDIIPGKRPPLLKGMYASVEFFTSPHNMLVLPRKAVHQGRVYVAKKGDGENEFHLEIRPIKILYQQGQLVVVKSGLEEGEKVIITDVVPVIDGLPLNPILAREYEARLAKDALGAVE